MPYREQVVTYKHLAAGVAASVLLLAGYAAWLIGRAEAAVSAHVASPNPHPGIEARFSSLEAKLDKIYWAILDERRRREEALDALDNPRPAPDPVPSKVKRGR